MSLPISVIVPTLNVRETIEDHVAALNQWGPSVGELLVVDSESTDGTLEYLRSHLIHPEIRWISRPKGLYAAWNAAVDAAKSEFVYIATVGDATNLAGIQKLVDVATTFEADVVLSPPRILGSNLEPVSEPSWPIHLLLSEGNFTEPMLLNQFQAFALANDFGIQGLLGSSASNLYRSAMLREFPFPTTFGHAGDTAWGCENALRVRIAVCPDACADFIQERDGGALADSECAELESKLLDLTRESIANAVSTGLMSNSDSMVLKTLHQGWCRSRNWMLEQVIHSEHVNSVSKQRAAYIEDLQIDGAKRVALMEEHSTEVARLQGELFRIEADR